MEYIVPYILPAVVAFGFCFFLTKMALVLFPKWELMDRPARYGLARKPIPYYGGLILFVSFMMSILLFVEMDQHVIGFILAATLITVVSFVDDWKGLSPWFRLSIQIIAALILVLFGIGIHSVSNPFGEAINLDQYIFFQEGLISISLLSALFTIIWIVSLVNTMNFLDGLNGLPSGIAAIAALALFFLSIRPDIHFDLSSQTSVAMMSIILFSVTAAFWLFDFYPAKILMGDTGSMFLGFTLATLAIFSGGKIATALLVLGVPILDAGWVIMRRILNKKSPLSGDLQHLHHRLLEAGLSQRRALYLLYAFSALFGIIAVFLQGVYKFYALVVLFIVMVLLGLIVVYIQREKKTIL